MGLQPGSSTVLLFHKGSQGETLSLANQGKMGSTGCLETGRYSLSCASLGLRGCREGGSSVLALGLEGCMEGASSLRHLGLEGCMEEGVSSLQDLG